MLQLSANFIMADRNGCTITGGIVDDTVAEHAKDPEAAEQLWNLSEKLVGQKFNY